MNILITGMIGSGAKDITREIADKLGRKFVDTDEVMTRNLAISLQEFYSLLTLESQADLIMRLSAQLAQSDSYVIAVGDMILTDAEAMKTITQNAYTVYIDRPIEEILDSDIDNDHPLLARGRDRITELFSERKDLYSKYANVTVSFSDSCVDEIITSYDEFSKSFDENIFVLERIDKDLYKLLYERGQSIFNNDEKAAQYAEKHIKHIQGEEL